MKTAISRFLRSLPRPLLATFGFLGLGLLSTIMAALVPFERLGGSSDGDGSYAFTFEPEEEIRLPETLTPAVTFSMPNGMGWEDTSAAALVAASGIDPELVLRAIAEVETRSNPRRVGQLGERGMYQFRRETWRQHTAEDFRRAHHPEISTTVARRHYDWITRELRHRGYEGTPYEVALAWNAGLHRVLSGRVPSRSRHYAERVANLAAGS
jgi:hypothetical protein